MSERARAGRMYTVGLLLFWGLSWSASTEASTRLDIEHVEGSVFLEQGTVRIHLDLLDDLGNVVPGLQPDAVHVYMDSGPNTPVVEVPGEIDIQTAAEARDWVAVAIVIAAHQSYAPLPKSGMESADEGEDPSVLGYAREGFARFARKLDGSDRVAVYVYDEKSLRTIDDWSEEHDNAADRIVEYARPSQEALTGDLIAPDLYKNLKAIVDDRVGGAENLPRRRIVLLLSDGKDASVKRERKMKRYTEGILEAARAHGVKLYTVGFSLDTTEHLVHLRTLANRSGGVYREVRPDELDSIPQVLENIAIELKKQYILTFRPSDDYGGSEKPVKLRIKMEAPGGRVLEDEYETRVRIGEKPFSWLRLLAIVGAVLFGLFLLMLIVRGIRGALASRRVRIHEEQDPYVATYKGRLAVNAGPDIGEEFLLTEDTMTIGSVVGNSIVLSGAGVSKRHAGLKIEDMRFELSDFGSTNGTTVNGNPITKQFLKDGDEIGIGENTLRFTLT